MGHRYSNEPDGWEVNNVTYQITDLVRDLRWPAGLSGPDDHPTSVTLRVAAADEIERLRAELAEARRLSHEAFKVGGAHQEEAKRWFEVHTFHQEAVQSVAKANGELLKRVVDERTRRENAEATNETLRAALARIDRWFGEFPPTGRFWDRAGADEMSYAACFGSNGERDYMRQVARDALVRPEAAASPQGGQ
jgi:hypothetical protein